jgi:hypothetical protein
VRFFCGFLVAHRVEEVLINTYEGAKTDRELAILLQAWLLLQKKASYNRNLNNSIKIAITQCPYCGKQFEFDLGKGVSKRKPHCGANECKKKYDRLKPSKQKRTSKSDWQSMGKKGRCQECKCVRKVNSDRICKKCFEESITLGYS